jgi:molybdopterin-containing oxidoreductase family membrane subunit
MVALLKRRPRINPFFVWVASLGLVFALGLVGMAIVFIKGLAVTNLTDLVPWGLWITIDLSSIALSAGAFLLCAAVYLLGLKQFQPVARTATFIGLIGYSMAVLTLLMDIGRPDRFWHALVFWNPHSVLWEVTMCVTLYFTVLLLETIPIIAHADWFEARWPKLAHMLGKVHHLSPFLAILGLGFSMLHQSSLGATYGIIKARPIWYRPNLSVLFMVSAMAAGPAFTALVTMIAGRVSKRVYVNDELVDKLAIFVGWVLVGYLYFRFWDAFAMTYTYQPGKTEGLALLTAGNLSFNFWVGEIFIGTALPMILLVNKRTRAIPWVRMLAFAMVVGGLVAYRWDTTLAGQIVLLSYLPDDITARYTSYVPSLVEFISGAGVVAYGLLAISLGVRFLNIVDHRAADEEKIPVQEPLAAAAD